MTVHGIATDIRDRPAVDALINETVGVEITSFVWTNFIGVSGLDYIAFFTGETREMTKVMDGLKNGVGGLKLGFD